MLRRVRVEEARWRFLGVLESAVVCFLLDERFLLPMAEDVDVEAADAAAVPLLLFDCCCEVDDSANVSVVSMISL